MPTKTLGLIIGLIIVTIVMIIIALNTPTTAKNQTINQQCDRMEASNDTITICVQPNR